LTPPECKALCGSEAEAKCAKDGKICGIEDGKEKCFCKNLKLHPPGCKDCELQCPPMAECVVEDGMSKCISCNPKQVSNCLLEGKECSMKNGKAVCVCPEGKTCGKEFCTSDKDCKKNYEGNKKLEICVDNKCMCNVNR